MYPYPGKTVTEKPPTSKPKKGYKTKSSGKNSNVGSNEDSVSKGIGKKDSATFHSATDEEIAKLQMDAKAQKTHNQTRWGIKILRGRHI